MRNEINLQAEFDKQLVIKFFYCFSRFEYALKRVPKYLKTGNSGQAEPKWDAFANYLGSDFFNSIKQSNNAAILFENPPEKQIVFQNKNLDQKELGWKKKATAKNNKELFLAIRLVRNNLFHGGKYPSGPVKDPSRNEELLKACLFILEKALNDPRAEEVKGHFDGPME